MRRGSLALIAILIVGGLTKLLVPPNQSAPAGGQTGTPTTTKAVTQQEPLDLEKAQNSVEWYPSQLREKIRDFFGVEHGPQLDAPESNGKPGTTTKKKDAKDPNPVAQICESLKNWCVPQKNPPGIQFVIATVPDPVHTHLGLLFDRSIDAIQQGATSQRYLFDRAIMPWQYFVPQDTTETDEDRLVRKVRESYPGLMIFRSQPPNLPLFVFVVGETPTAGINKQQFHRALEMIQEIREGKNDVSPPVAFDFGVLGPSFSGSLFSLKQILGQYLGDLPPASKDAIREIPVYTTVMDAGAIQDFTNKPLAKVRLEVFEKDGKSELDALLQFTRALNYDDEAITVLNEDDTAYGVGASLDQSQTGGKYRTLFFPRGISQFRSAYSKDLQTQEQTTDPNQPQRRNLRLDLEVTGSDDDNVAPYTPAQTALTQESIMLEIVRELRYSDAKFILIRATDHLDELFLARYLGSKYPDARLAVPTPDLLFAREEGGDVDGTLGLNTYPVSPAYLNQLCFSKDASRRGLSFPASASVALYNATSALLKGLPAGPFAAGQEPCRLSSNLWLTIVSRNSFHPIQVLKSDRSSNFPGPDDNRPEEKMQRSGRIQMPWAILCVLFLGLLSLHVRGLWKRDALGYWGTVKAPEDPENSRKARDWILWFGALVLVAILAVFISSATVVPNPQHFSGTLFLVIVLWFAWLGFVGYITCDFCKVRDKPILALSFCLLSIGFMTAGVAIAIVKTKQMVLWEQRALDFGSQVSPATPVILLLAALYGWFWYSLKAESLVDWRRARLPDAYQSKDYEAMAEDIRKVVPSFSPPRWLHASAGVVVALIILRACMEGVSYLPIRSLEGLFYDLIYSLLFAAAVYLLIATILRTWAVWRKLKSLFFELDRPGMMQALDRLKGFGWEAIWNPLESMQTAAAKMYWKGLLVVTRLGDSLGKRPPDALKDLKAQCDDVSTCLEDVFKIWGQLKNDQGKPGAIIAPVTKMQIILARLTSTLLKDHLEPSWIALPADDQIESSSGKPPDLPETKKIQAEVKADDSWRAIIHAEMGDGEPQAPNPSGLSAKSTQLAEELVACVFATFITMVLMRIRSLVFCAVVIYTAIVFSSASYPFQPAANLRTLALILFLFGGAVIGYVYEEMHSDVTLRRMTSTDPNKTDWAFWLKVIYAGLLPLLGLLSTLFPPIGHFLYTIAAPILQATR
jgi:hypothetical protein